MKIPLAPLAALLFLTAGLINDLTELDATSVMLGIVAVSVAVVSAVRWVRKVEGYKS